MNLSAATICGHLSTWWNALFRGKEQKEEQKPEMAIKKQKRVLVISASPITKQTAEEWIQKQGDAVLSWTHATRRYADPVLPLRRAVAAAQIDGSEALLYVIPAAASERTDHMDGNFLFTLDTAMRERGFKDWAKSLRLCVVPAAAAAGQEEDANKAMAARTKWIKTWISADFTEQSCFRSLDEWAQAQA